MKEIMGIHLIGTNVTSHMGTPVTKETILSDKMEIIDFHETGISISGIAIDDGLSKSVIHRITTPSKKNNTPESKSSVHRLTTPNKNNTPESKSVIHRITTPSKRNNTPDSKSSFYRVTTPNKNPSTPESERKSGRPRITTKRDDRKIVRTRVVECKTPTQISHELAENIGLLVSRQTVSRRLVEAGVQSRTPATKPVINCENQKEHIQYSTEEDDLCTPIQWEEVHLMSDDSDEPDFNFLKFDDKKPVRRIIGKRLFPETVKATLVYEASRVVLWGAISAFALGIWFVYFTSADRNDLHYNQCRKIQLHLCVASLQPNGEPDARLWSIVKTVLHQHMTLMWLTKPASLLLVGRNILHFPLIKLLLRIEVYLYLQKLTSKKKVDIGKRMETKALK